MSISWSVPGLGVHRRDSGVNPGSTGGLGLGGSSGAGSVTGLMGMVNAGRTGQNTDNTFAELMQVRGPLNTSPLPSVSAEDRARLAIASGTSATSGSAVGAFGAPDGTAASPAAPGAPGAPGVPVVPGAPADRLQHRALAALNTLTGGSLDKFGERLDNGLEAVQGILLNGGTHKRAPRGIALQDRSAGIALDPSQRRTLERRAERGLAMAPAGEVASTRTRKAATHAEEGLGKLAARFESGSEGIAAIGYDRVGGTSYGKYQIASRPGSMDLFLNFLKENDPALAERLSAAGPANTGSTKGDMPREWREIAAEMPEQFEKLQEQFIYESHYEPALNAVSQAGYNVNEFSPAMKEVLFSTAVQHGPAGAARIFSQAADIVGINPVSQRSQEKAIISEVYNLRADRFGSSTPQIQAAARRRMEEEGSMALAMR